MQFHLLNLLQSLLLPLALGAVVVAGLLVLLAGRKPTQKHRDGLAQKGKAPAQPAQAARTPAPAAGRPGPAGQRGTAQAAGTTAPRAERSASLPASPQPVAEPAAPAAAAAASQAAPAAAAAPVRPRMADLLLVDDSAVVRAKLRRLFEPAGYSLALAPDGEAALTLLSQGRYGLLLTDLEMPRLDGMGLIRATLADAGCAGMPILAITGHDNLQSQLDQLQAVSGIHRKPWVDEDLLHHVKTLVAPSLLHSAQAETA